LKQDYAARASASNDREIHLSTPGQSAVRELGSEKSVNAAPPRIWVRQTNSALKIRGGAAITIFPKMNFLRAALSL